MSKLWQKPDTSLHPQVSAYMISKNLEADNALVPYDVAASIAHAQMLGSVGLLSAEEVTQLVDALQEVRTLHAQGQFVLRQEHEDVHTEIENYLVRKLGTTGKKIHVGRSRNDQVLVAMRLFVKDALQGMQQQVRALVAQLLAFAEKHAQVPLPGFTHMQHAMPSSVGQWAAAFVEGLLNDVQMLQAAQRLNDQNPLGSAAGFGTAVPLDRAQTTQALGFARTQVNTLYCQHSRGKFEAATIAALMQVMLTLGKFANDMVIFTSQEFGFFVVDSAMTTGSSIMPQKRNLDIMEVLRANVSVVQSLQLQCQTVGVNLISGYNKDLKITKKPMMDALTITRDSIGIVTLLCAHMAPDEERLTQAFADTSIFAADAANRLVMEGMSFRDAYRAVGENLAQLEQEDVRENLKSKTHVGAPGNLQLDYYRRWLEELLPAEK